MEWKIVCDDVLRWAAEYDGPKFHALLTDCPYEMKFMGKVWDGTGISFQKETWAALAEHLLPGGFLFVFASSRGWHRLACAFEDAGLLIQPSIFNWHTREVVEVPFCLGWATGQSFPKASRIDTAIDKAAGKLEERKVRGKKIDISSGKPMSMKQARAGADKNLHEGWDRPWRHDDAAVERQTLDFEPATDLARAWEGHRYGGQILKNALEPIIVAQKPWDKKRLDCIVETGAGVLWVDGGRISTTEDCGRPSGPDGVCYGHYEQIVTEGHPQGRWPANFVLCHAKPETCPTCDGRRFYTWETWYARLKEYGGTREEWNELTEGGRQVICGMCMGMGIVGGCRRVGAKRVKGDKRDGSIRETAKDGSPLARSWKNTSTKGIAIQGHANADGYETVDAFDCVPECVVARLDEQAGQTSLGHWTHKREIGGKGIYGGGGFENVDEGRKLIDSGGPSRFYHNADWSHEIAERLAGADPVRYCPKAAKRERNQNLDNFYWRKDKKAPIGFVRIDKDEWEALGLEEERIYEETGKRVRLRAKGNIHSTVKPISLLVWLSKLLAPPKEYAPRRLLIPFSGSGSEICAAVISGCWEEVVGIEISEDYCEIARARAEFWQAKSQEIGSSNPRIILKGHRKKPTEDGVLDSAQMSLEL